MAETAEWAGQLRTLLKNNQDPEDSLYWKLLWAAEFRAAPAAQYDALRQRIVADVRRLESLAPGGNRKVLTALADGYS